MRLWIGDYLGDTGHLGALGHGAYLLLLMAMFRAGGKLPGGDEKLARIARCTADEWAAVRRDVLAFFTRQGGSITHARVVAERKQYDALSEIRSALGKKGAEARKAKKNKGKKSAKAVATAEQEPQPGSSNQNQSHTTPVVPTGTFDDFWSAYPKCRRVKKPKAREAWDRAILKTPPAVILAAAKVFDFDLREGGRFVPHPTTWLNQGRWMDEANDNGLLDLGEAMSPQERDAILREFGVKGGE